MFTLRAPSIYCCFQEHGKIIAQPGNLTSALTREIPGYRLASLSQSGEDRPSMAAPGLKSLESRYSVHETIDRLVELLRSKGIKIFARLDQAAEAQAVGISMRPMELLIFGDPKTGSPLMNEHPSLAIDLPLKALAWESEGKKVYLSFNTTEYLVERHHLEGEPFKPVEALLAHAAN